MSVANEINRLKQAKEDLKTAIEGKGVTVPSDTKLDGYGELVESISGGGEEQNDLIDGLIQKGSAFTVSEVYNDRVTSIGQYAFYSCSSLQSVSFPRVTSIGSYAFQSCRSLQSVSFPNVTSIDGYAFASCRSLQSVNFPKATNIGDDAFYYCLSLQSVDFPNVTSIGFSAFQSCSSLQSASLPNVTDIGTYAFQYCRSLRSIDFPNVTLIRNYAFRYCYNLLTLKLANSSFCTLSNSNAFTSTPIAGYTTSTSGVYGSIYVPQSLIASYKAATNWTYYSSRFAAIEDLSE